MKKKPDTTDRRRHTRTRVKNVVVGILNSGEPDIIGSITDISLGGAKLTYDALERAPGKNPINSIDLLADSNCLFGIPCNYTWDNRLEKESDPNAANLRQYGIQFGKLTPFQQYLLRNIIDDCTSQGINSIDSHDN